MTFKTEQERQDGLQLLADLQKHCTSDAQFRVYEERRLEVLEAKIIKSKKGLRCL